MKKLIRAALIILLAVAVCSAQSVQTDIKKLSLEDLMDVDVTSVSRRQESFGRTAAAITVLTAEYLRRAGVTNIPEALRLVPGLHVARFNAGSWAISARGFSSTSANKMLVLLDGRPVYSPLFSGTFWDIQDLVIDDIARIEVVRGPGATLWGANAVNGVINIITKSAHQTKSNLAVLYGGGADDLAAASLRLGGGLGPDVSYRVYGKYYYRDDTKFANGEDAQDRTRIGHAGFRVDAAKSSGDWTLIGDVYDGLAGIPLREDAKLLGGNILGRWTRTISNTSSLQVQSYIERNYRRVPLQSDFNQRSFEIEVQHQLAVGRHSFIWGGGYRWNKDRSRPTPVLAFNPQERAYPLWTAFAQDEISLSNDRLKIVLGSKFEHNDYSGYEFQPSVRANYMVRQEQFVWAALSRAVRTPNRFDSDIRFTPPGLNIVGNPDFRSEELTAYEGGVRSLLHSRVTADLAVFYNVYDDVRSLESRPPPAGRVGIFNNMNARTYGAEVAVAFDAEEWLRFSSAYSYLHKRLTPEPGVVDVFAGTLEGNDRKNQFHVRGEADLTSSLELDSTLRFVDNLPAPFVPSYWEWDARFGWNPRENFELSIIGRNLIHARHPESGPPGPTRSEVQRNIFARLILRF